MDRRERGGGRKGGRKEGVERERERERVRRGERGKSQRLLMDRTRIIPGRIEMREDAGAEANDDRSPLSRP